MSMKKYVKFGLLLLWMAVIFYLSSQEANDSTATTNFVLDILYKGYCLLIKNPLDINNFAIMLFKPVRKIAHLSEFAILGILVYLVVKEYNNKHTIIIATALSLVYAISDEIHQIFVPGRACTLIDVLIDLSGAVIGILIIHLLLKRWEKE